MPNVTGERSPEAFEREFAVDRSPRFEADRALIADIAKCLCNARIVDLSGSRLATARNVGNLDLTDVRRTCVDQLNEVSFADLGVVDVQHQPQVRIVDGCDQRERVGSLRKRRTRMINSGVEVLQAEDHSLALTKRGDPGQGVFCCQPHLTGDHFDRLYRETPAVQARAMQVESRDTKPCCHCDGLLCGGDQLVGPVRIDQIAGYIAGHRRERGTGRPKLVDVVSGPVPNFYLETKIVYPPHSFGDGQLSEDHLRTGGQSELGGHRAKSSE